MKKIIIFILILLPVIAVAEEASDAFITLYLEIENNEEYPIEFVIKKGLVFDVKDQDDFYNTQAITVSEDKYVRLEGYESKTVAVKCYCMTEEISFRDRDYVATPLYVNPNFHSQNDVWGIFGY